MTNRDSTTCRSTGTLSDIKLNSHKLTASEPFVNPSEYKLDVFLLIPNTKDVLSSADA